MNTGLRKQSGIQRQTEGLESAGMQSGIQRQTEGLESGGLQFRVFNDRPKVWSLPE